MGSDRPVLREPDVEAWRALANDPEKMAQLNQALDSYAQQFYAPPKPRESIRCRHCNAWILETLDYCGSCKTPREILHFRVRNITSHTGESYDEFMAAVLAQDRQQRTGDQIRDLVLHREVTKRQRKGWRVVDAYNWTVVMVGKRPREFYLGPIGMIYDILASREEKTWHVTVDAKRNVQVTPAG
jgi:hypothetical protein